MNGVFTQSDVLIRFHCFLIVIWPLLSGWPEVVSLNFWTQSMDDRLREGIGLFNERRFFECHEVLEALYQETEATNKPFIEGLIQLAAAFRIFCEFGEVKGPVRMIYQALVRFENYQPDFLQVRVSEAAAAMETWAKQAERGANAPPPSSVPKIPLQRSDFFS
jgi:hypothetical protein